jgi:hypothetical protein
MNKLSDWEPFEGAIYVGDGCCRVVFTHKLFPDFVIKIPFCDDDDEPGFIANEREASLSNKYGDNPDLNGICYARAKLLDNGWLVMERVERLFYQKINCLSGLDMLIANKLVKPKTDELWHLIMNKSPA